MAVEARKPSRLADSADEHLFHQHSYYQYNRDAHEENASDNVITTHIFSSSAFNLSSITRHMRRSVVGR